MSSHPQSSSRRPRSTPRPTASCPTSARSRPHRKWIRCICLGGSNRRSRRRLSCILPRRHLPIQRWKPTTRRGHRLGCSKRIGAAADASTAPIITRRKRSRLAHYGQSSPGSVRVPRGRGWSERIPARSDSTHGGHPRPEIRRLLRRWRLSWGSRGGCPHRDDGGMVWVWCLGRL